MRHKITVLAHSRKWGGRCVAGYDHTTNQLVRLVSNECGKELPANYTKGINLLDTVEVDVLFASPFEHQTENIIIDIKKPICIAGSKNISDFLFLQNRSGTIFGNNSFRVFSTSALNHSIELVPFSEMNIYIDNGKAKADFLSSGCAHKWYRITDIVHEHTPETISSGYAFITLPPSDGFTQNSGYYKYIAAIYPAKPLSNSTPFF